MVLLERAIIELSSLTASVTLEAELALNALPLSEAGTHISELGFFFFLRMAVAVSSACGKSVIIISNVRQAIFTSLCSAPDGSLCDC